jgi:hypothetical protein
MLYINQGSGKFRSYVDVSSDLYYSKVESIGLETSLEVNEFGSVL